MAMPLFDTMGLLLPAHGSPANGPMNMAMDEWLLQTADSGPALRIYQWSGPAVTFGYFQSHQAIQRAFPDLPLTRRWTGGGAVLHGDPMESTYALALPPSHAFARLRPLESYCLLHRAVAGALCAVGVDATVIGKDHPEAGAACFQHPVEGDVVASSGLKLAGAAQRRTRLGLLIQGSIRLPSAVPAGLPEALAQAFCANAVPLSMVPESVVDDLAQRKYGTLNWLERVP